MGDYEVLLFNTYFFDLIVTGLPEIPRLGTDLFGKDIAIRAGGTFNTARALHRLGVRVGWVCDFGNDLFSQYVLSEVRQEGLDDRLFRHHDHPVRVFSLAFSFAEDRGFISYMDPTEPYDRIPYVLEHRPKAVVLSSLEYDPQTDELVQAARQVGAKVYMDSQSTSVTLDSPGVAEALRAVDAFLPNSSEARQITGAPDAVSAAKILAEYTPLVVVKMGPEGAVAYLDGCEYYAPALQVPVIDTTGAGDCFIAGFIYNQLRGKSIEASLRSGIICGSLSTTAHGTVATPTLEQLEEYLGQK